MTVVQSTYVQGKRCAWHAVPGLADQRHVAATEHQEDADHLENGKLHLLTVLLLVGLGLERQRPLQPCRGCEPPVTRAWLVPPQGDGGGRRGGLCAQGTQQLLAFALGHRRTS